MRMLLSALLLLLAISGCLECEPEDRWHTAYRARLAQAAAQTAEQSDSDELGAATTEGEADDEPEPTAVPLGPSPGCAEDPTPLCEVRWQNHLLQRISDSLERLAQAEASRQPQPRRRR